MNGKYYWLKLKKDFFKRHDIKIIEGMPNGKAIVLFYIKLMLESVDHNGTLRFSDDIPYTAEMLVSVTDTELDVVKQALTVLSSFRLLIIDDNGTITLPKVSSMVGYETEWAKKKREYRTKRGHIGDTSGTNKGHIEDNVLPLSDKSKSIEKEIDIDIEKDIDIHVNTNNTIVQSESVFASKEEKIKLLFAEFWKAYPRKENKKKAYSYFKNIKHIEQLLPDILSDLETRKLSDQWNKEGGKYIPLPTSYLNGERWNDESGITTKQAEIENAVSDVYDDFFN